jgi:1-acyl-sn-glycerol-3-phosphate acyltransferase
MLFLRSALFFLGSLLVLITVSLPIPLMITLPLKLRYQWLILWSKFNIWWLKKTCRLSFNLVGKENIPQKACVVVSNHQSTWEALAFQCIFPQQTWVLKKELIWIPIFGWSLALLKPIIIDRGNKIKALKKVIKQGAKSIKAGVFVIIFPEGTRQKYPQIGVYQNGGIAIAKQADALILPVYHNAGKYWGKGDFIKRAGVINVIIGKPVFVKNQPASALSKSLQNWTQMQAQKNL